MLTWPLIKCRNYNGYALRIDLELYLFFFTKSLAITNTTNTNRAGRPDSLFRKILAGLKKCILITFVSYAL